MLIAAIISGAGSIIAGFVAPRFTNIEPTLVNSYYHFMWVLGILLAFATINFWTQHTQVFKHLRNKILISVIVGAGGLVLILLATDHEFRILADEANLLGLSMSLNHDRTYRNILEGSYYYDSFHPTVYSLDPRPAWHPFLLSLLHDVMGYSSSHGFVVNGLAAGATIALIFYISMQLAGWSSGIFAAGMLLANPIFSLGASSSGFESINLFFMTLTLWLIYLFLKSPTQHHLLLMVFSAVTTLHCRYESAILFVPIVIAIMSQWRSLTFNCSSILLIAAPILMIPYAWQRSISVLYHEIDATKPVFSTNYLRPNLHQFMRYIFDVGATDFPMNPGIACLALIGIMILFGVYRNSAKGSPERRGILLCGLGLISILGVHMTCWVVDYRTVAVQRYAISYATGFAILAALTLFKLQRQPLGQIIAWGLLALVLTNGLAKSGKNTQGRWLTLYREYKMNREFLSQWPRSGTLLIADRPGMYAIHEYGAMSFDNANKNPRGIIDSIRRKLTPNVFVEQRIYYDKPYKPSPELSNKLPLETVHEYQNDSQYYVRISRIVLPPPWPPTKKL